MNPLVIYLLKSNLLLIFFWLFYRLFLRKETFYTPIRWYFVGSVVLSLIVPLLSYTRTVIIKQELVPAEFDFVPNFPIEDMFVPMAEPSFWETIDWQNVLLFLIGAISLILLLKSGYQIFKLYMSVKNLPSSGKNPLIKITQNQQNIYSFYRWIVVPENKISCPDLNIILAHEKIHLNQKHTLDLIFIELVSAVFWFNPLIKRLQKDINTNLEFIVDEKMVVEYERVAYQKSLLQEQSTHSPAYINAFSTNDLKKRIIQLNTQKSKSMKKLKFLLTAPVLVAFFVFFQVETVAQIQTIEMEETTTNETSYIVASNFSEREFKKLTKELKDKFDIEFIINRIEYKDDKVSILDYIIQKGKHKVSSSTTMLEGGIDPFLITVSPNGEKPFRVEKYPENEKYSYTVDDRVDVDFDISKEEWKNKSWIDKITKKQKTVFLIDGKQVSASEVRQLADDEVFTINIYKDKGTVNKYGENTDCVVVIRTEKQIRNVNTFSVSPESLKSNRENYEELIEKFPVVIDDVPQTKEQLKKFDNTKIQSMYLEIIHGTKNETIYHLSTKPVDYDVEHEKKRVKERAAKENYITNKNGESVNGKSLDNLEIPEGFEKISIYNRWGNLVYESKENKKFEKKQLDNLVGGTYFYVIRTKGKEKSGYIQIETEKNISTTTIDNNGIFIENPAAGININNNDKILLIVDGKEVSVEDFKKIDPKNIENITILSQAEQLKPYGEKGKYGVMLIKTKSQKKIDRETAIEKRRVEAEKKRKEMIERHRQAMTRHEQAMAHHKQVTERKSVQNQKEDNFMDDFHQINYVLNKTKSIKDEVKDENSETRQILVKMFLPEEEEEMEVSRNY